MFRISIIACLIIILQGCNYWPAPSTGGYAAHYLFNKHQYSCGPGPSPICQIQRDRLTKALFELNLLRTTRAVLCRPARYRQLRLLGQQIAQEIVARLYLSAQVDLNLFDVNLKELNRLNTLKGCPRATNDRGWESLKLRLQ